MKRLRASRPSGTSVDARAHIFRWSALMFSIDHIGVAVKSLAAAKGIYERLGLSLSHEEVVESE